MMDMFRFNHFQIGTVRTTIDVDAIIIHMFDGNRFGDGIKTTNMIRMRMG